MAYWNYCVDLDTGRVLGRTKFDGDAPQPRKPWSFNSGDEALAQADTASLRASMAGGQVVGLAVDPAYQPPAPPPDRLAELAAKVDKNVAASPHDKRFLTQKAIGKQAISWIRARPACTPQEAEDYVMGLIASELPGEPAVAKLYWEHQGKPQGLAMSYLAEAIKRGYVPAGTPLTWASFVGLVVNTLEAQLNAWLRAL